MIYSKVWNFFFFGEFCSSTLWHMFTVYSAPSPHFPSAHHPSPSSRNLLTLFAILDFVRCPTEFGPDCLRGPEFGCNHQILQAHGWVHTGSHASPSSRISRLTADPQYVVGPHESLSPLCWLLEGPDFCGSAPACTAASSLWLSCPCPAWRIEFCTHTPHPAALVFFPPLPSMMFTEPQGGGGNAFCRAATSTTLCSQHSYVQPWVLAFTCIHCEERLLGFRLRMAFAHTYI